ncbi:MAG: hypothetical protein ABJN26_16050 [Stappiaceae bacterium]
MIEGQFTATGTSPEVQATEIDLSVSGTFVGSIAVQRKIGDSWRTVEEITAANERVFKNAQARGFRLECTAHTSGTIDYAYG